MQETVIEITGEGNWWWRQRRFWLDGWWREWDKHTMMTLILVLILIF